MPPYKIWIHAREYQVTLYKWSMFMYIHMELNLHGIPLKSILIHPIPIRMIVEPDQNPKFKRPPFNRASMITKCLFRTFYLFSIEVGKYWNIISTAFVSTSIFSIQNMMPTTIKVDFFRLSRDMNNKRISCVAKNNEINDPKTRTVTVQMNRKKHISSIYWKLRIGWFSVRPQSVKILRKETYLTEGQKVHIVCEVENDCNILIKSPLTFCSRPGPGQPAASADSVVSRWISSG